MKKNQVHFFTFLVFFGLIHPQHYLSCFLNSRHILDFSEMASDNTTKHCYYRKQILNIIYQVCFLLADMANLVSNLWTHFRSFQCNCFFFFCSLTNPTRSNYSTSPISRSKQEVNVFYKDLIFRTYLSVKMVTMDFIRHIFDFSSTWLSRKVYQGYRKKILDINQARFFFRIIQRERWSPWHMID